MIMYAVYTHVTNKFPTVFEPLKLDCISFMMMMMMMIIIYIYHAKIWLNHADTPICQLKRK